jgi:hypothetical protein
MADDDSDPNLLRSDDTEADPRWLRSTAHRCPGEH